MGGPAKRAGAAACCGGRFIEFIKGFDGLGLQAEVVFFLEVEAAGFNLLRGFGILAFTEIQAAEFVGFVEHQLFGERRVLVFAAADIGQLDSRHRGGAGIFEVLVAGDVAEVEQGFVGFFLDDLQAFAADLGFAQIHLLAHVLLASRGQAVDVLRTELHAVFVAEGANLALGNEPFQLVFVHLEFFENFIERTVLGHCVGPVDTR
jgi:hypothetical protein